jgi:hypothetical protein
VASGPVHDLGVGILAGLNLQSATNVPLNFATTRLTKVHIVHRHDTAKEFSCFTEGPKFEAIEMDSCSRVEILSVDNLIANDENRTVCSNADNFIHPLSVRGGCHLWVAVAR